MSQRQRQDRELLEEMRAIFEWSGGTYGSPRLFRTLRARGWRVSRAGLERLMRLGGCGPVCVGSIDRKWETHRWFGQHPNHVRGEAGQPDESDLGGRCDVSMGRVPVVGISRS